MLRDESGAKQCSQCHHWHVNPDGATCALCLPKKAAADAASRQEQARQEQREEIFERACVLLNGDHNVAADAATACALFRQGAEQAHAESTFYLGCCFLTGEGVIKDETAASEWFRKAADLGHARAQYHLAVLIRVAHHILDKLDAFLTVSCFFARRTL